MLRPVRAILLSSLCLFLILLVPLAATADSVSVRVTNGDDDGEQAVGNGSMNLTSSDLELINDDATMGDDQLVGIRFLNMTIPQGATINSAYLDFTVDETGSSATSLTFHGEAADDPAGFTTTAFNISNRTTTTAAVAWNNVPAWNTVGTTQTTPDLTAIVQEVVDRGGWSSGNAMVFIVTGSGQRIAESYNGVPGSAPLLRVDYTSVDTGPPAAVANLAAGSSTSSSVLLTWTAPGDDGTIGTATTYDIRYSTSPITLANWGAAIQATGEPSPQTAGSSESFNVTGLLTNTTYYFAIKTADEVPQWSDLSNVLSAATAAGSYPSSNGTNNTYEWITNVSFADINNSTGQESGGYTDFTAQIANVVQGASVALSVTINPDSRDYIYAWIDWNRDYDFTDAGEVYVLATNVSNAGPHSTSVSVPLTALTGTTRMRVSLKYDGVPQSDEVIQYGEVEDYSVRVSATGTTIKGKVVEDVNGDGDLGDSVGHANVTVRLYLDGGDGLPSGSDDTAQASTVTAIDGSYSFAGVAAGVYWVTVDSRTVPPNGGFGGGFGQGDVWAEQTYGPVGGLSDNGVGGYTELVAAGACYGGRRTEQSDNAGALGTSEHLAKVTDSGAEISNVDFGFSFNVITRTGDGDDDGGANRTVQGSLRQFIQNSNAIVDANSSYFVIPTHDSGYDLGGHGEYRIQPTSALPALTGPATIDGTTQNGFVDQPLIELDGSLVLAVIDGLHLTAGSDGSTIRGLIINRFTDNGIHLENGGSNIVAGNYIGIDAAGDVDLGNASIGIFISPDCDSNRIGGTVAADRNIVSGSGSSGVRIGSADGNLVQGNFIGTDATGMTGVGSALTGITIDVGSQDNVIGGLTDSHRNVVCGASANGIRIAGIGTSNNSVLGNYVGTDASGAGAIPNANGISFDNAATDNTIGGTVSGAGNLIASNTNDGVRLTDACVRNAILGNEIRDQGQLGIDLGNDGVTGNDPDDGDGGPNGLQNYPVLTSAVTDAATTINIAGTLDSSPSTTFRVEFFSSTVAGGSGYGEGERYLGYAGMTTDINGDASFNTPIGENVPIGAFITATATDPSNNTSEFSQVIEAYSDNVLIVDTAEDYDAPDGRYGDTSSINALLADKGSDGLISLREAITACNNTPNGASLNGIHFSIDGAGPHTIQPISALPAITDPVIIDGTSEPDFSGTPIIELDGSGAGPNISGLTITAGSSTVRGLVINRFTGSGIRLESLGGNTIAGNYIGPDAGGMTGGVGNFIEGIYIYDSPSNFIGGTTDADRNVISGNRLRGIWIDEVTDGPAASSAATRIRGNYIGTNADGTDRLPYSGGGSPAYQQFGIALWDAIGNTIGGSAFGEGNVISGNSGNGIYLWGPNSATNLIQGNIIGLNAAATASVGNGFENTTYAGVYISSAPDNILGGLVAGEGNVISGNAAHGVVVHGASATGNIIAGNSIHDNAGLGIDLDLDGVTPNDPDDGDTGGNNLLNYPVLTSAVSGGGTITVQGDLTSIPNTNFRILFYSNSVADPSGYGEGETFIGAAMASTDGSGHATIDHTMPVSLPTGYVITATATDPAFNTSEFSAGEAVVGTADVSLTKSDSDDPVATGGALLYTLLVTNNGPDTATGVTVVDNLPADVTLQSVTVSQGTWSGTSVITCNLGAILNGGTATIEILVIPTGTGTINNTAQVTTNDIDNVPGNDSDSESTEVVSGGTTDVPLTLYQRIHGFVDFTTTGGSLRTEPNGVDPCAVTTTSAATLAGIPPTGTVTAAYLYWAASGSTVDVNVTLDGGGLTADRSWQSTFVLGATSFDFFGCFKDVTAEVVAKGNGLYTFSDLTIDSGNPYCGSAAVLGGWSLIVIYEDLALSGKTLVIYDGFDLERNGSTSYLLSGIYAADPPEAKTALLVWEGDDTLGGTTESLEFNGTPQSDALNPVNNVYNGSINTLGVNNSYGLDLDTFDVSGLVNLGDTFATTTLLTGPDLVILNAVVLEAKTNVIAGAVYEDVNYGGGPGRNLAAAVADAPSFAVGRPNVTVELYDAAGNYFRSTTTSASGAYGFTGLADGNYFVRAVNGTVTSSRNGSTGSEWAIQTYRTDGSSGSSVAVTNEIGGADPSIQDDPVNGSSDDLTDITAQSVAPVLLSNSLSVTNVDFGYNFDTIVNTNDSGQGSLRQFILNSNALENTDLDQDGLTPDIETSIFQIPATDAFYNRTGNGEFSILPDTPLDPVTDPVIISGATHPDFSGSPLIELDGTDAGAGAHGLTITGGGSTVQSLVINRYTGSGIVLSGSGSNTILSCYLGTDVTGSADQGNSERGLWIRSGSDDNTIGGTAAGAGNLIAFNGTVGVGLEGGAGAVTGNAILGNSLHDNGSLGIDLSEDGFTDNDPLDADTGTNNLQNFPVVTYAQFDGANLTIRGNLSSAANTTYRVEFFANQAVDPSGYGEGETYLNHTDLLTDGSGQASFDVSFPLAVSVGHYISATATDPNNNTSEFGADTIVYGVSDIILLKSVVVLNDPANGSTNPKAIPGAEMLYTVAATNQGNGPVDEDSVALSDAVPANAVLYVGDIDNPGSGPLFFENGTTASGLSYTFTALDSTTDDIAFSDDDGVTYDYEPVADAEGYDVNVTNWRVEPTGTLAFSDGSNHPSFSLKFKVRLN